MKHILKNYDRRKFLRNTGISVAGLAIMNLIPFKVFGRKKIKRNGSIEIKINTSAIKRTKTR